jgi:CheY-like chemotaxis protein
VTVENPIEIQMPGITQTQVDVKADITFASVLRSMLRQDPDVILVGEMRDRETAAIAVEASQTGHLLLSTIHTNDAPSTITRLLDFDIDPFKITSSLRAVLAQRLVRRVCPQCAVDDTPDPHLLDELASEIELDRGATWRKGIGCRACHQSGYSGRVAIHELLEVTDALRELIYRRAPDHAIREHARRDGMRTLIEDGFKKAAQGLTTVDEVMRVAPRPGTRVSRPKIDDRVESVPIPAAPLAPAPTPTPQSTPQPDQAVPHILVLDDDSDMQALLRLQLESGGYQVTTAGDGVEALLQLGRQSFDLILSDIRMPNLDGLQLLELRTNRDVRVPIVVLSADSSPETEQTCLELGAVDYIAKPIKKDILLLRVKRAIRQMAEQVG